VDLWVWIAIFIVAWLLEALASAAKKKRQQEQQPPRPPRPQGPPARRPSPVLRPSPPPRRPVTVLSPRDAPPLVFAVPVERRLRARDPEPTSAIEGISAELEVVEPPPESTDASHRRVTEKYRAPVVGEIGGPERQRTQARFVLRPRTVREAIVWMEILGRPKSERM
jgi:hypothetical protein